MPTVYIEEDCTIARLISELQQLDPKLLVLIGEGPIAKSDKIYINRCSSLRSIDTGVQNLARLSHNLHDPQEGERVDSVCLFPSD